MRKFKECFLQTFFSLSHVAQQNFGPTPILSSLHYYMDLYQIKNWYLNYTECKGNNFDWLKDIHHFLVNNGLGHIWNNVANLKESYVKSKIDQRLRDQYNQYYTSYRKENIDKSKIVGFCVEDYVYLRQGYLNLVKSPHVRSIIRPRTLN